MAGWGLVILLFCLVFALARLSPLSDTNNLSSPDGSFESYQVPPFHTMYIFTIWTTVEMQVFLPIANINYLGFWSFCEYKEREISSALGITSFSLSI